MLCQAFADGNAEEAQKQFTAFLRKTISIRDTYVKAAKKENFYHGILLGLLSYRDDWIVAFVNKKLSHLANKKVSQL